MYLIPFLGEETEALSKVTMQGYFLHVFPSLIYLLYISSSEFQGDNGVFALWPKSRGHLLKRVELSNISTLNVWGISEKLKIVVENEKKT